LLAILVGVFFGGVASLLRVDTSPIVSIVIIQTATFISYTVLFLSVFSRGRVVGDGDISKGLGLTEVSNIPLIVLLGFIIASYALLLQLTYFRTQVHTQLLSVGFYLLQASVDVVAAPISEELFLEGGCGRAFGDASTS
jgi:hypothetical protein